MYVPFAGRIAPATALNRVGLLPTRFPTEGGPVRARAGCLQRCVPAVPVQSGQLGEGKTGHFLPRIARVRFPRSSRILSLLTVFHSRSLLIITFFDTNLIFFRYYLISLLHTEGINE